jgi:hypothetical protein
MTYLEAINQVLRKLREPQVTSAASTEYSGLIGQLVNEARREVEDAWNWIGLRTTVTLETEADTSQYVLSGVGNSRFKLLDVVNDTTNNYLVNEPATFLTSLFLTGSTSTREPTSFGFNGFDSSGDPIVDLYPIPDAVYNIRFNIVLPQNDLVNSNSVIKVPAHIVVLGAYVKALVERGEDASSSYEAAMRQYTGALGAAIAQEDALMPGETDFYAI